MLRVTSPLRAYEHAMQCTALRHTRSLVRQELAKEHPDRTIKIEVWGELRAAAYMQVGWSPETETRKEGEIVMGLTLDTPPCEW